MFELLYHKHNHLVTTVAVFVLEIACLGGRFGISHKGDLSQKSPEPKLWLLVNHTKHFLFKLISFNSRQLRIREEQLLQNNSVNGAISITVNRVII